MQLTEGRDFNHKTLLGAVNPCFWLGAVMCLVCFQFLCGDFELINIKRWKK